METVVIDAQALFYLQKTEIPKLLNELRQDIMEGKIRAIIPTIAISELLWKVRRTGDIYFQKLRISVENWKKSPNIIIDSFDNKIIDLMLQNKESYELHDEIIAMTCLKYDTSIIYTKDPKFEDIWHLELRKW
jgi:predicted nucleic acid-binding protein